MGVDLLRQKFADQRAQGSANVISEEEEELVVNFLQSERQRDSADDHLLEDLQSANYTLDDRPLASPDRPMPHSAFGSNFTALPTPIRTGNINSSPFGSLPPVTPASPSKSTLSSTGSYHSKRYSNNLFGSGRLKDQGYIRQVKKQSSNRQLAALPTVQPIQPPPATSNTVQDQDSPTADEFDPQDYIVDTSLSDNPSSDEDDDTPQRVPDIPAPQEDPTPPASPVPSSQTPPYITPYAAARPGLGFGRAFSAAQVHRASLALEEVIRNFEQDANAEEQILTPRSPSIGTTSSSGSNSGSARRTNNPFVSGILFPDFVVFRLCFYVPVRLKAWQNFCFFLCASTARGFGVLEIPSTRLPVAFFPFLSPNSARFSEYCVGC